MKNKTKKKVVKAYCLRCGQGYTEFNRGYDAGMAVGIEQTNEAWMNMTSYKREQIAREWKKVTKSKNV